MLKLLPRFLHSEEIMAILRFEEVDSIVIKHTLKVRISMAKVGKDLILLILMFKLIINYVV